VYLTGDDLVERHRTLFKALTNTEVVFFERLKDLDYKMNRLAAPAPERRTAAPVSEHVQALDTLLTTLDGILSAPDTSASPRALRQE
jgi:hypothetical protein